MAYGRCSDRDNSIHNTLLRNIGRVCTIFTNSGGPAGAGFTGVLSDVDGETCRLVSISPQGFSGDSPRRRNCCGGSDPICGTTQVIPIDKINCVSTTQL